MGLNLLRLFQPTNSEKPLGGRYTIISQLGAGGFGQTFLAEDLHLPGQPQCVVKQLKPQVSDAASLETARRLFDTEARVLYQLGNHDQIPRLLAHFEENQEFYLAQELIVGKPLTQELVKSQPWLESQTIALLQDLLDVLAFVHQQNVIHRDIKPSNLIRRSSDGRIVLIDFGAVKQVSTQLLNPPPGQTNLTISIGTQGYVPKEQLGGQPRFSSDVYAVGIIGIQALTGVHPRLLKEDSQTGEINWRDLACQVSPELAEILDCMVRYDFRVRYQTATEAMEALQSLSPLSPPLSEVTQAAPNQAGSTESGTELTSTNIWLPAQSQPTPSSPELSETQPQSQHSSGSSVPTIVAPGSTQRQFLNPWLAMAVLAAVGGTLWFTKTFLFPQLAHQTPQLNRESVEPIPGSSADQPESPASDSPAVKPTPQSSDKESDPPVSDSPAAERTLESSDKKSDPPAAETPTTASTPKNLTEKTAQPTPTSSPVAAQPSLGSAKPIATRTPAAPEKPTPSQTPPASAPPPAQSPPSPPEPQVDAATAASHWQRCYDLNLQQRFTEAIAACDQALSINPDYPEALWSKGAALQQQGKHQDALKLYERATTLKPDFADAWINQGVALILLNQPTKAVVALDKATTLKPDSADAWVNKAEAFMELERFDDAIASLKKALAIQPNNEYALSMLLAAQAKR